MAEEKSFLDWFPVTTLNPTQLYLTSIQRYQLVAKYVGIDVYSDNYKVNLTLVLSCMYNMAAVLCFIYEIVVGAMNRDLDRVLQGSLFIGTMVQV